MQAGFYLQNDYLVYEDLCHLASLLVDRILFFSAIVDCLPKRQAHSWRTTSERRIDTDAATAMRKIQPHNMELFLVYEG